MASSEELQLRECHLMVDAISRRRDWIHRRVESLSFQADGPTRRRVSVDLTVPQVFSQHGFVPIALLDKKVLFAFDLRDSSGASLALLNIDQNAELSFRLLASGCEDALDLDVAQTISEIVFYDRDIYNEQRSDPRALIRRYKDHLTVGDDDVPSYLALAEELTSGFLLTSQLPHGVMAGDRTVIKFAYEESIPTDGWFVPGAMGTYFDASWSSSAHFEIRAPEQLLVKELYPIDKSEFVAGSGAELMTMEGVADEREARQIAHIVIGSEVVQRQDIEMVFRLAPERRGLVTTAAMAVGFGVAGFSALMAIRWSPLSADMRPNAQIASALLLLVPALMIGYLARNSEHEIVGKHLLPARIAMMLVGLLFFTGAVVVSGVFSPDVRHAVVPFLAAAALIIALVFIRWWITATRRAT